mgnify:FL=1
MAFFGLAILLYPLVVVLALWLYKRYIGFSPVSLNLNVKLVQRQEDSTDATYAERMAALIRAKKDGEIP